MTKLANAIFQNDWFNIYILLIFGLIGFLAGFFLRMNSQKGKNRIAKMEKDATANKLRIAGLKAKADELEKENKALGGSGSEA